MSSIVESLCYRLMRWRAVTDYTEHDERVEWRGEAVNFYSLQAYRDGATFFRAFPQIAPHTEYLRGKRILDIGCGFGGRPTYYAELAGEQVAGIDIYRQAVAEAKRFAEVQGVGTLTAFAAAGAEAVPFPDDTFDLVTSYDSLEHVANPVSTLREVARVLRPGGTFLGVAPSYLQPYGVHLSQITDFPYLSALFSERTLIRALRRWASVSDHVRHWVDVKVTRDVNGVESFSHINKYLVRDFRRAVRESGLEPAVFDVRCFLSRANMVCRPLMLLPGIRELLARSIVLILRKRDDSATPNSRDE